MVTAKPTVLVVSQTPDRSTLDEAFDRTGLELDVVTVEGIPEAKQTIETREIDCIVSDYEIPDADGRLFMGGLRLLEYVRDKHGELPFILFTFVVNEDSVRRATTSGVTAYIRNVEGEDVVEQLSYHVRSAINRRLAERRASEQARINEVIRDVNDSLVREQIRDEMIDRICHRLIQDEVYQKTGFAFVDQETAEIESWAVGESVGLDTDTRTLALVSQVVDSDTVQTDELADAGETLDGQPNPGTTVDEDRESAGDSKLETGTEDSKLETGTKRSNESGRATRIGIPVVYEKTLYGVLVLETRPSHTFYEMERNVLGELGETIGHALNAIDVRNSLVHRERELSQQKEQLERFAGIVSHDIRNPLNVAQGMLTLLQDEYDISELEDVEDSLNRISSIVEDILELARSTSSLSTEPIEVDSVARMAWDTVETGDAEITIEVDATIEADRSHFQRIFENLFRNAIEHGSSPADSAFTVRVFRDGDAVIIEDNGVGIDESIVDDLFEMGQSGSSTGTGLGLSIVRDLVQRHGWTISASNAEDGGAQFRIHECIDG